MYKPSTPPQTSRNYRKEMQKLNNALGSYESPEKDTGLDGGNYSPKHRRKRVLNAGWEGP